MMNFQVPQFIEVEDKIFGPLTFRQFVYLAGGAGLAFMFWVYLTPHFLALFLIVPVIALAIALAFYKVNSRPFVLIMEASFRYLLTHKLYLWRHGAAPATKVAATVEPTGSTPSAPFIPKLSESRLKDLAWSLDIKEQAH